MFLFSIFDCIIVCLLINPDIEVNTWSTKNVGMISSRFCFGFVCSKHSSCFLEIFKKVTNWLCLVPPVYIIYLEHYERGGLQVKKQVFLTSYSQWLLTLWIQWFINLKEMLLLSNYMDEACITQPTFSLQLWQYVVYQ